MILYGTFFINEPKLFSKNVFSNMLIESGFHVTQIATFSTVDWKVSVDSLVLNKQKDNFLANKNYQ